MAVEVVDVSQSRSVGGGGLGRNSSTPNGGGAGSGGNGGSGIVILRGPSAVTFSISPGCSGSTSTHPGGDKLVTITASGTLTIS